MNKYSERVKLIQGLGYDAVIITGTDPHSSEYPSARWKQVEWISGFTGEAGDIVITRDHAGLWTDTRYFIQAVQQLKDTGIELHKTRVPQEVSIPDWLKAKFPGGARIAIDGLCQSIRDVAQLQGFDIVDQPDMLSQFWIDRPGIPSTPVSQLSEALVGESHYSKISSIQETLAQKDCDAILLSSLDEIAWTLNVRAEDIDFNPYIISYLLIKKDEVLWFVRDARNVPDLKGVRKCDYDSISQALSELNGRVIIDPSTLNYSIYKTLLLSVGEKSIVRMASPVKLRKSIKNETEIEAMRRIHIEDGLAMEHFLYWLDCQLKDGKTISEWDASVQLTRQRSAIKGYHGNSFDNISAFGENAALPHYCTDPETSDIIKKKDLYLVDSGGQYDEGTTDITRTIVLGSCCWLRNRSMREDYTLVLKGMIDLSMAVFPRGTAGCQIDAIARNPLWQSRKNFGHGTGHGIGFYLGVHEGPQNIGQNFNRTPLLPGMITSIEPGLYREGKYGIRHENLVLCKSAGKNEFGEWLCFETLTICHIDTNAVIKKLLTKDEIKWLNNYNKNVYKQFKDRVPLEMRGWLRRKTRKI